MRANVKAIKEAPTLEELLKLAKKYWWLIGPILSQLWKLLKPHIIKLFTKKTKEK